jgi:hypothetical protein
MGASAQAPGSGYASVGIPEETGIAQGILQIIYFINDMEFNLRTHVGKATQQKALRGVALRTCLRKTAFSSIESAQRAAIGS